MDVCFVQGQCSECRTHSRGLEQCGRCQVQVHYGQDRLETSSQNVQGNRPTVGPLEVDLFASQLSNQLSHYFNWKPDSLAGATDAFSQQWQQFRGYANPPWCLIGRVLSQVKYQQAQVILVAPVWMGHPGIQSYWECFTAILGSFLDVQACFS